MAVFFAAGTPQTTIHAKAHLPKALISLNSGGYGAGRIAPAADLASVLHRYIHEYITQRPLPVQRLPGGSADTVS
jgi:hypothetical protein